MNKFIERAISHLPHFKPPPHNWNNRGKITITYSPCWRNIPIIRNFFPYWVGDKVVFRVHTEKPWEKTHAPPVVHQIHNNGTIKTFDMTGVVSDIDGMPVWVEGDMSFTLGFAGYTDPINEPLIFNANIQSKDRWLIGCAGLVLGAVLTFFVGLALGFIEIRPFWEVWMP